MYIPLQVGTTSGNANLGGPPGTTSGRDEQAEQPPTSGLPCSFLTAGSKAKQAMETYSSSYSSSTSIVLPDTPSSLTSSLNHNSFFPKKKCSTPSQVLTKVQMANANPSTASSSLVYSSQLSSFPSMTSIPTNAPLPSLPAAAPPPLHSPTASPSAPTVATASSSTNNLSSSPTLTSLLLPAALKRSVFQPPHGGLHFYPNCNDDTNSTVAAGDSPSTAATADTTRADMTRRSLETLVCRSWHQRPFLPAEFLIVDSVGISDRAVDQSGILGIDRLPPFEGYLLRRPPNGGGWWRHWIWPRRYFVLQSCHLYWFRHRSHYLRLGLNGCEGSVSLVLGACKVDMDCKNGNRFILRFSRKSLVQQINHLQKNYSRPPPRRKVDVFVEKLPKAAVSLEEQEEVPKSKTGKTNKESVGEEEIVLDVRRCGLDRGAVMLYFMSHVNKGEEVRNRFRTVEWEKKHLRACRSFIGNNSRRGHCQRAKSMGPPAAAHDDMKPTVKFLRSM
eukprot:GHVS01079764.1.p1 GENE.GHVS01079764.1~~GHVS01079764.1.p1  ORF type:complete len:502 (-),score=111.67 GHVS01079764.1:179-1684(-)